MTREQDRRIDEVVTRPAAAASPGVSRAAVPAEPAEENPAQREKTQRLPERHRWQAEERRQQRIPQELHHPAADERDQQRWCGPERTTDEPAN